jgi:hypothetical protein
MHIDLTADEAAVVTEVLDSALGDLREQIYKAEVAEFKEHPQAARDRAQGPALTPERRNFDGQRVGAKTPHF